MSNQYYSSGAVIDKLKDFAITRGQVNNKESAGENIQKLSNILGSLDGMMKNQGNYIKNFNQSAGNEGDNRQMQVLQIKSSCEKFLQNIKNEVLETLTMVVQKTHQIPKRQGNPKATLNPVGPFPYVIPLQDLSFFDESKKEEVPQVSLMLNLFIHHYEEVLDALRNYAKLKEEDEGRDVNQNKMQRMSLRKKIEQLTEQIIQQNQKIDQLNDIQSADALDFLEMKSSYEKLTEENQVLNKQIQELKSYSEGNYSEIALLKDKLEQEKHQTQLIKDQYLPKLAELSKAQTFLDKEFKQIKKDMDQYAALFRNESRMRSQIIQEKNDLQQQFEKLVDMLGREKQKNKELKRQVYQKEDIVFEIIESQKEQNSQFESLKNQLSQKQNLKKEESEEIQSYKKQMEQLESQIKELNNVNQFLNKRINNLEEDKQKLIQVLKKNDLNPGDELYMK
ncbi:hypothetical protein PPERSA_11916 [Pseudocohnilembus persalinus]|uniref:Uncharacterized protein n=1 Tax=Pseudocohnilembus persalinus TaxID=266149 RepID=A0A0V0QKJ5_PSEPJ|nr:hypothetical protein PPERSA_11916 [Pseudocohnilembus persalinus]|eukprot:KRX02576.1 hypothetical protein PPERSA_11916 [Pseudocohnilembus persalinus]